jgi:hypothetical protein
LQFKHSTEEIQFILFAFFSSLLATTFGYGFGIGNQPEQLPIVMRAMDPTFLTQDAFVNASASYGPRYLFAHFTAWLALGIGLPAAFYLLTLIGNFLIALFTGYSALTLFERKKFSALFAIVAVLCCKTFWLGYSNIIYRNFLEPMHLAMPLAIAGFLAMLKNRPVLAMLACGLAAVFHPLFGLECAAIYLFIMVAEALLFRRSTISAVEKRGLFIATGIFIVSSVLLLYPYDQQPSIPADTFIQILAVFRHPHHYLPSTFPLDQYVQALTFLFAIALTWWAAAKIVPSLHEHNRKLIGICIVLGLLAVGGYVFVELIPIRLFTSAQLFRLLILIKWLGLLLLGGWIGTLRSDSENQIHHLSAWTFVLGLLTPLTMALAAASDWMFSWLAQRSTKKTIRIVKTGVPILLLVSTLVYELDTRNTILLMLLLLLVSLQDAFQKSWQVNLSTLGLSALLLLVYLRVIPLPALDAYAVFERPAFTLEEQDSEELQLARWVKENTPTDAVFLSNPSFGYFRYAAERALVVSYDSFPFQDQAMLDWQQRIFDCYGQPQANGFDAIPELRDGFTALRGDDLIALQKKYHFTHAVLYDHMETRFQVLYRTENYKVILVKEPHS